MLMGHQWKRTTPANIVIVSKEKWFVLSNRAWEQWTENRTIVIQSLQQLENVALLSTNVVSE